MKKSVFIFLFFMSFLITGQAQTQPSDTKAQPDKKHDHGSHGKRGGHHVRVHLFHHHHGKKYNRSVAHAHHDKKGRGDKESIDKK